MLLIKQINKIQEEKWNVVKERNLRRKRNNKCKKHNSYSLELIKHEK